MRVLYLVLGANGEGYPLLEDAQRRTWASDGTAAFDVLWVHFDKVPRPLLSRRRLTLPGVEHFDAILDKTIQSLAWAIDNFEFEFVLRTNLATYFHHALLQLERLPRSRLYAGYPGIWSASAQRPEPQRYASGAGILMSRDVAKLVAAANPREWVGFPDDVAIARILAQSGIAPTPMARTTLPDGDVIRPSYSTRLKVTGRPEATSRLMFALHNVYTAPKRDLRQRLVSADREQRRLLPATGLAARQLATRWPRVTDFARL